MKTWQCIVCGFIYDEAEGLEEEGEIVGDDVGLFEGDAVGLIVGTEVVGEEEGGKEGRRPFSQSKFLRRTDEEEEATARTLLSSLPPFAD